MTDRVKVEFSEGVTHVRLNRPEKKNALDADMFDGLLSAARELREDASVRAIVLSVEGDSFCSVLDFTSFGDMASGALNPTMRNSSAARCSFCAGARPDCGRAGGGLPDRESGMGHGAIDPP